MSAFSIDSDTMGNKGAFLTITGDDLTPKFTSFDSVVGILLGLKTLSMKYGKDIKTTVKERFYFC